MKCEDNSKLRIPLDEVCQTTDIGCVPIVEGKPDCSPQPDELPLAFDKSTTTLWIYACDTREWVPFQKFSMCQLSSISLDNIKNICDILQIGVNYNPGTGCRQGTISLGELAEQILKCIKLQTKVMNITTNGDKIKLWVEGLDTLPPFYVQGRNIWSEGGTGTETDPLKIATNDPICKWPTLTQAQVDATQTKHLGACLDGNMYRVPFPPKVCELPEKSETQVAASKNKKLIACMDGEGSKIPYPKQPCEFPQMTIEQVHAAQDKDMIVCVNGENGKVPIYDGLLTPICDNPQISIDQAKKKPKLRIVSCEDGKIALFPLPPEMFQGEYMCVPFIDGIPKGAPLEGTGPIRFDCNNDIWFWVCEENRWHRIDVGNHYHPKWMEVYRWVANRCDNIKFHGWSEQDECYTDFEMTPQELANFILCECLDFTTPAQINAAIDRGEEANQQICVNGVTRKVDWSICSNPEITPAQINEAINQGKEANLAICVDGKNYKTRWNVCAYPGLSQKDLQDLSKLYLTVCAEEGDNYENRIIEITKFINNYVGIDIHSAGTHLSGNKGFDGNVTPQGGKAVYISTSASPIIGSGSLSSPPFGSPSVTLVNNSKILKLYTIFHVVRLFRTEAQASLCNFGVSSALTSTPSFCDIGAYISNNFDIYNPDGDGTDLPWKQNSQCSGANPSDVLSMTTEQFNLANFDEDFTRAKNALILPKNGGLAQYNGTFWQKGATMQFTFMYLLPGQTATVTMRSMSVVSNLNTGDHISTHIHVGGSTRFFVVGYSASLLNSDF